jgi:hypothetical protein
MKKFIVDGFEIWAETEVAAINMYRLWCMPCWN